MLGFALVYKVHCKVLSVYNYFDSEVASVKGGVSKKSRIRETKHLSTDTDSSTDAIGGDRLG